MRKIITIITLSLLSVSLFAVEKIEYHQQVVIGLLKGKAGSNCQIGPITSDHGASGAITFNHNDGFSTTISTVRTVIKEDSSLYSGSQIKFNFVDITDTKTEFLTNAQLRIKVTYEGDYTNDTFVIDENEEIISFKSVFRENGEVYLDCK